MFFKFSCLLLFAYLCTYYIQYVIGFFSQTISIHDICSIVCPEPTCICATVRTNPCSTPLKFDFHHVCRPLHYPVELCELNILSTMPCHVCFTVKYCFILPPFPRRNVSCDVAIKNFFLYCCCQGENAVSRQRFCTGRRILFLLFIVVVSIYLTVRIASDSADL